MIGSPCAAGCRVEQLLHVAAPSRLIPAFQRHLCFPARRRETLYVHLGFAVEAIAELRIVGELGGKDFDGDDAIEARVARLVDLAHTAGSDGGDDFIRAESSAGSERHGEWLDYAGGGDFRAVSPTDSR